MAARKKATLTVGQKRAADALNTKNRLSLDKTTQQVDFAFREAKFMHDVNLQHDQEERRQQEAEQRQREFEFAQEKHAYTQERHGKQDAEHEEQAAIAAKKAASTQLKQRVNAVGQGLSNAVPSGKLPGGSSKLSIGMLFGVAILLIFFTITPVTKNGKSLGFTRIKVITQSLWGKAVIA